MNFKFTKLDTYCQKIKKRISKQSYIKNAYSWIQAIHLLIIKKFNISLFIFKRKILFKIEKF